MRGVASPLRSQLLTQVLAQGGAQCAATLKRWAREKRAYRGEVFSEEEVDAAIASLQAAKAESFEPGPGLQVSLRWPSWPPEALLAAARCAVAPRPPRGTAELLRGLFEAPGDVVLVAGRPAVRLGAHRPLLAHFSEALRLKFEGGYKDSKELLVEVEARPCVVRSAVEFLYTGRCVLDVSSLGDLLVLADYWQAAALSEAIQVCWYRLPIVHQLEVMSNLDENSIVPKAMVGALVNSLTASFKKASECFPSPHCWTLVKELQDWISRTPEQALARMRHWLSLDEDELQDAVESFLIKGIEAASSEEQRQLLMRRSLKVWLPEALQRHVVMRLIDGEKAVDDSGQFRFWLLWVTSGGLRSELLFMEVYSQLEMKLQEDLDELRRGQYLQGLQRSVGRQLADQSYFSDESAFWCRAKLPDIMLSQAIACFAAAATCGRPFPPLPCSMINCALEEALLKLEVTAVLVEGSKAVAGVYERKGSIFRREGHIKEPVELVYIEQSEGQKDINKFSIIWKGLPAEYKKARGLWAFQSPGNELSAPHALLLSRHDPWSDLGAHWWLNQGGSFQHSNELLVRIHKLLPQHAELLRRSLTSVDLRELAQVARVPVLREMCWEAQGSKQVEKEAGAPHGKAIGQREEEMSDWKEAARLFDDVASELCQLLGAMKGGDAELRRRLLAKKRRLESGDFLEAVKRLERR